MQNNKQAMRMANSPDGQQLLKRLQQTNGQQLSQAINAAAKGDYEGAKSLLSALLQDPQTRELLDRMGGSHGPDGR